MKASKKHMKACVFRDVSDSSIMNTIDKNIHSMGLEDFKKSLKSGLCSHCTSCQSAWILVQIIYKEKN